MQFTTAVRNARLSAISTQLGAGGTMKAYTGSSPGVGNAATGTLLATLTAVTCGSPSAGAMAITATADPSEAASGTPGYARLATSGGTAIADLTAAVGSGEANFSANPALGGTLTLSSCTITEGNA
jgi:hypothetical protein